MKKLKVLLALITEDNDYQREQAAVAQATAGRLGIDLQVVYADNDAIAQTKQILTAVHAAEPERLDALVVEPVGTGMLGVASAAATRDIGWVVLNRDADYLTELRAKSSVPIGSVVSDSVEVGRIQGRQIAALLPAGGTVFYVEGPPTDITKQRRAGLDQTIPANIQIRWGRGDWTEESGYKAVESRLKRDGDRPPPVGLIGCMNDAMAMGARKAVQAFAGPRVREQWLEIPFTGVDGVPSGGKAWVQQGLLAATVITPPLAGVALELLAKAVVEGSSMPERTSMHATSYPAIETLGGSAASERP